MNTGDMFRDAAEKRAQTERERQERAATERTDQEAQLEKARSHATTINQRLRDALDYFSKREFPAAKQTDYDFQHNFEFSPIPELATSQLYTRLTIYAGRNVTDTMGSNPPYRSHYELELSGDETTGRITAHFRDNSTKHAQQLDSLNLEAEMSESWLHGVFETFAATMLQADAKTDRDRR
jgi:hypothetical protein